MLLIYVMIKDEAGALLVDDKANTTQGGAQLTGNHV